MIESLLALRRHRPYSCAISKVPSKFNMPTSPILEPSLSERFARFKPLRITRAGAQTPGEKIFAAFSREIQAHVLSRIPKNIHWIFSGSDCLHLIVQKMAVENDTRVRFTEPLLYSIIDNPLSRKDRVVLRIDFAIEIPKLRLPAIIQH